MNEKLLHFIWKFQLFKNVNLQTTDGESVEIIQGGNHNTNAGADFLNAKIRIGETLWAGNVEIHVTSSDWNLHSHQTDAAYDNVILHVVFDANGSAAKRSTGEAIPTLVLKGKINPPTLLRYEELEKHKTRIPCHKFFPQVDSFTRQAFLERLLTERLETKVESIQVLLQQNGNDWENVLFQMVAKYFGASINKEPFLQLAQSLPVKVWSKHNGNLPQIEALVFGQAGFLEEKADDDYANQLRKEYLYLKKLHNLQPLKKHLWKFLRLRPSNFPTLRLAQLAALMNTNEKLFSKIRRAQTVKQIQQLFDVEVSEYWHSHYLFDKPSKKVSGHIGSSMKNVLLINAIAPVLFAYGKYKDSEEDCEKAILLLENCEAESNAIIKGWGKLSWKAENAYQTQGMLQLKTEYCDKFRCLQCAIGTAILK